MPYDVKNSRSRFEPTTCGSESESAIPLHHSAPVTVTRCNGFLDGLLTDIQFTASIHAAVKATTTLLFLLLLVL